MTGLENWPAIFLGFFGARILYKRISLLLPPFTPRVVAMGVVVDLISDPRSGGHCRRLEMIGPGAFSSKQPANVVQVAPLLGDGCFIAKPGYRSQGILSQPCVRFLKGANIFWQSIMQGNGLRLSIADRREQWWYVTSRRRYGGTLDPWLAKP